MRKDLVIMMMMRKGASLTVVKPAVVRVCLVKSAAPFFQCTNLLTFTVIIMKRLTAVSQSDP